jgi:hypothetical protein
MNEIEWPVGGVRNVFGRCFFEFFPKEAVSEKELTKFKASL